MLKSSVALRVMHDICLEPKVPYLYQDQQWKRIKERRMCTTLNSIAFEESTITIIPHSNS